MIDLREYRFLACDRQAEDDHNDENGQSQRQHIIGIFLDTGSDGYSVGYMGTIVHEMSIVTRKSLLIPIFMKMDAMGMACKVGVEMAVDKRGHGLHQGKPKSDDPEKSLVLLQLHDTTMLILWDKDVTIARASYRLDAVFQTWAFSAQRLL